MPKSLLMEEEMKKVKKVKFSILKALTIKRLKTNLRDLHITRRGRCQLLAFSPQKLCSQITKRIKAQLKGRWTSPTLPSRVQLVVKEYPQRRRTMFLERVLVEVIFRIKKNTILKRSLVTQQATKA